MSDCDSDCGDCNDCKCGGWEYKLGCGCGWGLALLIIILSSLSQVQFNEYAFRKPWGQEIDQTKVYEQGVHMLGFWNNLVVFPADVVDLQLNDMSVFSFASGDEDAGTSLILDVGIQYKLDPDFLSDLFDIGGATGYINQISAEATEIIKNNATGFNADTYLNNRRRIERSFFIELFESIKEDFANTEVINVQLLRVVFPDSFYRRKLDVGLQEIKNDIQAFNRETVNVRDTTAREVLVIENVAKRKVDIAKAQADLTVTKAQNLFDRAVGEAKITGMRQLADALNITSQADFLSLNYLVQLLNNEGSQKKFVNFAEAPEAKSLL